MKDGKTVEELVDSFIAKIEAKERDRQALDKQLGKIYRAAKAAGLNHKVLRRVVLMRLKNPHLCAGGDIPLQMYMQEMKAFMDEEGAPGSGTRATRAKKITSAAK